MTMSKIYILEERIMGMKKGAQSFSMNGPAENRTPFGIRPSRLLPILAVLLLALIPFTSALSPQILVDSTATQDRGDSLVVSRPKASIVKESSGGALLSPDWVWNGSDWIPRPVYTVWGKVLTHEQYPMVVFDIDTRKVIEKPATIGAITQTSVYIEPAPIGWFNYPSYVFGGTSE